MFEVDDFYGQGRYPRKKPRVPPFYELLESWQRKLWMDLPRRNFDQVKVRLSAFFSNFPIVLSKPCFQIRIMSEHTYPNLEPHTIERHNVEVFKQVLVGEKPLPVGLGWNPFVIRENYTPYYRKPKK